LPITNYSFVIELSRKMMLDGLA